MSVEFSHEFWWQQQLILEEKYFMLESFKNNLFNRKMQLSYRLPYNRKFLCALLIKKSTFCQKVTVHKDRKSPSWGKLTFKVGYSLVLYLLYSCRMTSVVVWMHALQLSCIVISSTTTSLLLTVCIVLLCCCCCAKSISGQFIYCILQLQK